MAQHFSSSERQEMADQDTTRDDVGQVSENHPVEDDVSSEVPESPEVVSDDFTSTVNTGDEISDAVLSASAPLDETSSASMTAPVPVAAPQSDAISVPDPLEGSAVVVADEALDASGGRDVMAPQEGSPLTPAVSVPKNGTPTVSLRNVTMIYPAQPNKPALEDVSVDIYSGEFVFIVGHSGSGKSTFIRLLTRELRASKGQVFVAGQELTKMRNRKVPIFRRQLGCVFQDFKLLPDKTTYQNVAFALECIGKPKSVIKVQVPEVLRLVGLGEKMDNYPDQLSGGEQQRVAIARAMVNRPPLLVCDEPTGNLDPAISMGIMKLLERINRAGTTVVMATHDREMVDSMRKRVIALEAGHVVRDQERGGYGYYV